MNLFSIILFYFFLNPPMPLSLDIIELRKLYYDAAGNKNSAVKFFETMERMQVDTNPLLLCYKGMAHLIRANYSLNPYKKLSYFTKGKEMLENAIKSDPQNIEIHFMRFCVQTNAPFFLGYSRNIELDKSFILSGWSKISDPDLKEKIKKYMLESDSCTPAEKSNLK